MYFVGIASPTGVTGNKPGQNPQRSNPLAEVALRQGGTGDVGFLFFGGLMFSDSEQLAYTIRQSATLAQVSEGLIRRMIKSEKLRAVRIGKLWRVPREELFRLCGCAHRRQS